MNAVSLNLLETKTSELYSRFFCFPILNLDTSDTTEVVDVIGDHHHLMLHSSP